MLARKNRCSAAHFFGTPDIGIIYTTIQICTNNLGRRPAHIQVCSHRLIFPYIGISIVCNAIFNKAVPCHRISGKSITERNVEIEFLRKGPPVVNIEVMLLSASRLGFP